MAIHPLEPDVTDELGDAVFELLGDAMRAISEAMRDVVDHARDAVVPPADLELTSQEGVRYSGVVVVNAGKVVAMVAVPAKRQDHVTSVAAGCESQADGHADASLS